MTTPLNVIILQNLQAEHNECLATIARAQARLEVLESAIKTHKNMMIEDSIREAQK